MQATPKHVSRQITVGGGDGALTPPTLITSSFTRCLTDYSYTCRSHKRTSFTPKRGLVRYGLHTSHQGPWQRFPPVQIISTMMWRPPNSALVIDMHKHLSVTAWRYPCPLSPCQHQHRLELRPHFCILWHTWHHVPLFWLRYFILYFLHLLKETVPIYLIVFMSNHPFFVFYFTGYKKYSSIFICWCVCFPERMNESYSGIQHSKAAKVLALESPSIVYFYLKKNKWEKFWQANLNTSILEIFTWDGGS